MPFRVGRAYTIVFLALTFVVTVAAYVWFIRSSYFPDFLAWANDHELFLLITLIVWKTTAIAWPPLPGSIITFGAIPIVGWLRAYIADFIGSLIGSSIAFWIAYRWGIAFVAHLLGPNVASKLSSVQIPPHREFEAMLVFRILGSGLAEIICYAAGILRIHFGKYIAAIAISHALLGIPAFYFGGQIFVGNFWTISLLVVGFALAVVLLRKRYLTTKW